MRVKSEIDLFISVLIWSTIFIMLGSIAIVPQNERVIAAVITFPMIVVILWIYFGTYYEFQDKYLYCKSGPFFERIAYEKIKSVKSSRNLLSSMGLSTKRIDIRQHGKSYITGTTYISPVNREEFMQELYNGLRKVNKKSA